MMRPLNNRNESFVFLQMSQNLKKELQKFLVATTKEDEVNRKVCAGGLHPTWLGQVAVGVSLLIC